MTFEHARRNSLNRRAVGDVAFLVLVSLRRPPREADNERSARTERTHQLSANARRSAGDDRYLQTLSTRPAAAWWPTASVTVASSLCVPFLSFAVFHDNE